MNKSFEAKTDRVIREFNKSGIVVVRGAFAEDVAIAVSCLTGCNMTAIEGGFKLER